MAGGGGGAAAGGDAANGASDPKHRGGDDDAARTAEAAAGRRVARMTDEPFGVPYLKRRWKRFYRNCVKRWRLWVSRTPKRRAGGLVVDAMDRVLLINSRKHADLWIVPAGTVERGESTAQAAIREVEEEAGVTCALRDPKPLGEYVDEEKMVVTTYYAMVVEVEHATWEDKDLGRVRRWWPIEHAAAVLKERDRRPLEAYLAAA